MKTYTFRNAYDALEWLEYHHAMKWWLTHGPEMKTKRAKQLAARNVVSLLEAMLVLESRA